jgi:hypothetical protein
MGVPPTLQSMIERELADVRKHPMHQFAPFRRKAFYEAFIGELGKRALAWLEILAVRFVLPKWPGNMPYDWTEYPTPQELVEITENKLLGKLDKTIHTHAELLASEMVSITSEDPGSPFYPAWCVFEAAVSLFFRSTFNPTREDETDDALWGYRVDVTHLVLIAYAGHIQTTITDMEQLKSFWEWWYYKRDWEDETPLPWTHTLDPQACLEFWGWWFTQAVPQAWDLAAQTPPHE